MSISAQFALCAYKPPAENLSSLLHCVGMKESVRTETSAAAWGSTALYLVKDICNK